MNHSSDAADQIVKMSLDGIEFAVKITGAAAKEIAILLYTILKDGKKTKGKARLTQMLRSGKELKVFSIRNKDLKTFKDQGKKYGVLYCVLKDSANKNPNAVVDIIARAEDASKISRIVERFKLASIETDTIVQTASKILSKPKKFEDKDLDRPEKNDDDKLLDASLAKPIQKEGNTQENPSSGTIEKFPLFVPSLDDADKSNSGSVKTSSKPSIKAEIERIKAALMGKETKSKEKSRDGKDAKRITVAKTEHQQPKPKSKPKKPKGR